ncbi:MAG: hypothetical protein LUE87_07705, partial [Lachnospiraceae bacterium]|nr:hypothetical protein [Lachnospiraceae bacterium]
IIPFAVKTILVTFSFDVNRVKGNLRNVLENLDLNKRSFQGQRYIPNPEIPVHFMINMAKA